MQFLPRGSTDAHHDRPMFPHAAKQLKSARARPQIVSWRGVFGSDMRKSLHLRCLEAPKIRLKTRHHTTKATSLHTPRSIWITA